MSRPGVPKRAVLSQEAQQDIQAILAWSRRHFGSSAALRYRALLMQAFRDLELDPSRLGSQALPGMHDEARTYHLTDSRKNVQGKAVASPRHFILYRIAAKRLDIARVLHDSRDLARHIPDDWLT